MEKTNKKSKKKSEKEKVKPMPAKEKEDQTSEGIPDVDFKKFLGCG